MADWYDSEPSLGGLLVTELRRLKRRAQSRWPLVVLLAAALTAAVVWKTSRKPSMYRARLVLALTEGDLNSSQDAFPLHELRDYIGNVLLSNAALLELIEEKGLFASKRARMGDDFVIATLRDMFEIAVWRNYFQYTYSYDERRTARVAVVFTHADPDFAYEMARALTNIVIAREGQRRVEAAQELASQAQDVLAAARARLAETKDEQHAEVAELAAAEARGDSAAVAVHRLRASELASDVRRAEEAFFTVEQTTTAEALQAAVTEAGLALDLTVVDERRPPRHDRSPVLLVGLALFAMMLFLPLAGIVVGAFDTRIHDLDDVGRLELAPLGHLPGFPGDRVGALRERGVGGRRVTSWRLWR